mmetsp:Transcript_24495/g.40416  ORF Transcript_24495/g.40416 Transcript_24495/m.40416 type:complete len:336 (+) Transcript_24495:233-1240(+)
MHLTKGLRKFRLIRIVDKVPGVIGVICCCDGLSQSNGRITRLLSGDISNLSEHQILNVGPLHSEVNDISLDIHTSASCATLHLLCNQCRQVVTHVTTEDTRTERHINSIRKSFVGEDNGKPSLLCKHLHLTAVARKSNFVCVNSNSTAEATDESMVDVNAFASLLHVSNDIFNLVISEAFSSGRKDVFVMWLCCIILGESFVSKARLRIFFSLSSIHTASLTSSYLTHLGLVASKFDQILTIVRKFRNLFALQTGEQSLKHGKGTISVKLECNCWEEISVLQLGHNVIEHVTNVFLCSEWRRKLCLTELLIELRMRLGECCQAGLEPCFVLLGLI